MKIQFRLACVGLLVASMAFVGCSGSADPTSENGANGGTSGGASSASTPASTYASPDEVFSAFKSAASKDDLKKFMACMSAKSQAEFSFGMVMMSGFLPMKYMNDEAKAEALGKEIESILDKHGLSEDKMNAMDPASEPDFEKFFAPVKDRAALVADVYAVIVREDPDTPLKMLANATLKDVKIDGNKASGKMVAEGEENEIEFVNVNGSWLIEMPGAPEPGPSQP